jgi:hypothetical protein
MFRFTMLAVLCLCGCKAKPKPAPEPPVLERKTECIFPEKKGCCEPAKADPKCGCPGCGDCATTKKCKCEDFLWCMDKNGCNCWCPGK